MARIVTEDIEAVIRHYHRIGYTHTIICHLLNQRHAVPMKYEYLKRKVLPRLGLNNRRGVSKLTDFDIVLSTIEREMGLKEDISIADMHHRLKVNYGFVVRRSLVRSIVRILDPIGTANRKGNKLKRRCYISKGPNWIWHLDQYDKLSPFGICITGCIDGFSRYMIWLKAGVTNKQPKQIAACFLQSVEERSACPHIVRADAGTENVTVAAMQNMLRENNNDSMADNSFVYGKSTHNQRIERWWGTLRSKCTDRWINHFKKLQAEGNFVVGSKLHKCLVQFCYLSLIRTELEEVKHSWNHHRIRRQTLGDVVTGIPDLLYHNPELLHNPQCRDYAHVVQVNGEEFRFLKQNCAWDNEIDSDFATLANAMCDTNNITRVPSSAAEAKNLYLSLKLTLEPLFDN
ncbi:uncharacterized protein LOC143066425 [Mytilus galloprovincialis]|uniref:uncharacterized protein LOC143066425 n=1 Tax=Mytilus galloprovincialis TaxID=29158 RepID=UPI003F7BF815